MENFLKVSLLVSISLGSIVGSASDLTSTSKIPSSSLDSISGLSCEFDANNVATVIWANNTSHVFSKDSAVRVEFIDANGAIIATNPTVLFGAKDILPHRMSILGRIPAPTGARGCHNPYMAPAPAESAGCHLADGKAQFQLLWSESRFRIDGNVHAVYFDENAELIVSDSFSVKTESLDPGTYIFAERVAPAQTKFCMWEDKFRVVKMVCRTDDC